MKFFRMAAFGKAFAEINRSYYESFMMTTEFPKNRTRWWIPAAIVALAVANVVRLRTSADLDAMTQNMQTWFTVVVSLSLLMIWWLFLTRLRWRTRLAGLALVVLCLTAFKLLVRVDG